jgi:hypothetical protein
LVNHQRAAASYRCLLSVICFAHKISVRNLMGF